MSFRRPVLKTATTAFNRYQACPFVAMATTIPSASATMPPIHAVFARESGRPCARNWLWAMSPRTIAAGEHRNQQTIPIADSTVGVLDGGFCGPGMPPYPGP
jgi:hypothetical protein